jgi:hypothetical protein
MRFPCVWRAEKVLEGLSFSLDDEIQEMAVDILCQLPWSFYRDAISKLVRPWDERLNFRGDSF